MKLEITRAIERRILQLVNAERESKGRPALLWIDGIGSAARRHSDELLLAMPSEEQDWHAAYGVEPASFARYSCAAAENVAFGSFPSSGNPNVESVARQAVDGWIDSAGHYNNLLNSRYYSSGIGVSYKQVGGNLEYFATQGFCG